MNLGLNYDKQIKLRESLSSTDIYKNHFKNSNPNLIYIGRLTKVKRLDLLIDALSIMAKRGKSFNLTLIGDGAEITNLQKCTVEKNVSDNTWFYGACYSEKANAELIFNADLCVAPGNIGLTAMHVLVFGTPAATHNNFAYQMPEFEAIEEEKTGTFFEYQNAESIAETVLRWFDMNDNKREEIRKNCYSKIDSEWNPYFQIKVLKSHLPI